MTFLSVIMLAVGWFSLIGISTLSWKIKFFSSRNAISCYYSHSRLDAHFYVNTSTIALAGLWTQTCWGVYSTPSMVVGMEKGMWIGVGRETVEEKEVKWRSWSYWYATEANFLPTVSALSMFLIHSPVLVIKVGTIWVMLDVNISVFIELMVGTDCALLITQHDCWS